MDPFALGSLNLNLRGVDGDYELSIVFTLEKVEQIEEDDHDYWVRVDVSSERFSDTIRVVHVSPVQALVSAMRVTESYVNRRCMEQNLVPYRHKFGDVQGAFDLYL